jgi:osmoprotectant transport system ATP-binding protein
VAASDPNAPVVAFVGVRHAYGTRVVLNDLNLSIARGEALALVGRSGAGKSTVLKLINRLLLPQAGAVLVDGRDTRQWNPIELRRRTGYVMQEVGLFPHLTVQDNVTLVPRLEGWTDGRRRARAVELLELVGLPPAEFAGRWPHELSGGQRQRVGVARALASDPPVLLMDEPFGALDPMTRVEVRDEFQRIRRHLRLTVVLVTHDAGEALALGDRVGVLDDGRLIACDTPERIARATDPKVRQFLDALYTTTTGSTVDRLPSPVSRLRVPE